MEIWTITKLLDWTTEYFKKYQIEWPHLEAEILLAHLLKVKRIQLYVQHERVINKEELAQFKALIQRRSQHEPIAYITGIQPFMSLDFEVNPSVLIPRPETEKLVEIAIDLLKSGANAHSRLTHVLDIGTGSGCIAISLAKYLPQAHVVGVDSSAEALEIAKKNAEKHQVEDRCDFRLGNLFEPAKEKFDLIVTNPPYIPTQDIATLQKDVKDFEPIAALDGGSDGLDYIRQIIKQAPQHLKENGGLILEFGINQAEAVKQLAQEVFIQTEIIKDNAGINRLLFALVLADDA